MLSLEEAQARILAALEPLPFESVSLPSAAGRVLAEEIISPMDLPAFDNSAMDGYAVRAEEMGAASLESPVRLKLAGQVAAGGTFSGQVPPGSCVRIFTGSALPAGTNAVVMQEDTRPDSELASSKMPPSILFLDGARRGENVRHAGEDVRQGAPIGAAGDRLNSGRLALLAAVGLGEVRVHRAPRLSLLATGSELMEPGQPRNAGKIFESNRIMLASLVAGAGGVPRTYPIVPDRLEETTRALEQAFAESDGVITSGGVSVGDFDFVKSAFEELGGTMEFWRVAIKPGKPFVFGKWRGKLFFGLPGNPVSAFVTFLLLVRTALRRWQGLAEVTLPSHPGVLTEPVTNRGDRRHFLRVQVDAESRVRSVGAQASHLLGGLAAANGLLDLAPETTLPAGATVRVLQWEG